MGKHTHIQWADHTFNPWWGCTRVGEGCRHCYAESLDKWLHKGAHWGPGAKRLTFGLAHWEKPYAWDAAAEKAGERRRVFCGSMCDVLDPDAPSGRLGWLFKMIKETPYLDWLLLSKRPQFYRETFERLGCPDNIWAGASASTQAECDEACRHLQYLPTTVEFLSLEPLIERIVIPPLSLSRPGDRDEGIADRIDWVIVGGESGPGARVCHLDWIDTIRKQCFAHNIACFVKQMGAKPLWREDRPWPSSDPKGGNIDEFPTQLQVRQVPDPGTVWP